MRRKLRGGLHLRRHLLHGHHGHLRHSRVLHVHTWHSLGLRLDVHLSYAVRSRRHLPRRDLELLEVRR
jgi:hypothetical protein